MDYYVRQVEHLRQEMVLTFFGLSMGLLIMGGMAIGAYIAAVATGKQELYRLMVILIIGTLFFAAKNDYVGHRCGAWIALVEPYLVSGNENIPVPPWEQWKAALMGTKVLLPTLDILMALPFIWVLLVWQVPAVAQMTDYQFAWLAGILTVLGIASIPAAVKLSAW